MQTPVMKGILFLPALIFFMIIQCGKLKNETPVCIQQKIREIKTQSKWNPPAEVNEYLYHDKKVYLFSSNCCDQYNMLYDDSCNYICAPLGGITGRGDGACRDFYTTARHVKLVCKDNR